MFPKAGDLSFLSIILIIHKMGTNLPISANAFCVSRASLSKIRTMKRRPGHLLKLQGRGPHEPATMPRRPSEIQAGHSLHPPSHFFSLRACFIFQSLQTGFFHLSGAYGKSWLPHSSHIGLHVTVPESFGLAIFQSQFQTLRRKNLVQLGPKVHHFGLWHRGSHSTTVDPHG